MTAEGTGTSSVDSKLRKAGRMLATTAFVLLAGSFLLAGFLLAVSPGRPKPYVDAQGRTVPGSLSEKVYVNINGMQQGMFIKSRDTSHPVLLYLHGGMPDYFLTEKYPTGLDDYFTVAWWEQRGSGMSYSADVRRETLTIDQMIADTLAVTDYLRQRFGKDKIYLMGHSGGSFIGIETAARSPERYAAYLGVAQMSNQLLSEKLAYDYMLAKFRENGNTGMVRKLESMPVTLEGGIPDGYDLTRDTAMHSLGIGTMHDMNSIVTGILLPSWLCREYTLKEKVNLWAGKAHSGIATLWKTMVVTDLTKQQTRFDIPIYFFGGVYDYTVSYTLAKSYLSEIKAPVKGFYTFEHSAHSPMFEEPARMLQIIKADVLTGRNSLADRK